MPRPPRTPDVFDAIADPTRRELLELLRQGEQSVTRLAEPFEMSQPAVSQHLRVLRQAGLVAVRRAGRERRYRLETRPLGEVRDWLARYETFWDDSLTRLGGYLEGNDP